MDFGMQMMRSDANDYHWLIHFWLFQFLFCLMIIKFNYSIKFLPKINFSFIAKMSENLCSICIYNSCGANNEERKDSAKGEKKGDNSTLICN